MVFNYSTNDKWFGFGTYGSKLDKRRVFMIKSTNKCDNLVLINSIKVNNRPVQTYRILNENIDCQEKKLHAVNGGLNITHCNKNLLTRVGFSILYISESNTMSLEGKKQLNELHEKIFHDEEPEGHCIDFRNDKSDDECNEYGKHISENFSINENSYPFKFIFQEQEFNFNFTSTNIEVKVFSRYFKQWIMHLSSNNCISEEDKDTNMKIINAVNDSKVDLNFIDQNENTLHVMDIFQDMYLQTLEGIIGNKYTNFNIDKVIGMLISFIIFYNDKESFII